MSAISQDNRLLELVGLQEIDGALLTHFSGTEVISDDFSFDLDILTDNLQIDPNKMLGKAVTVNIHLAKAGSRIFNGIVETFTQGGIDYKDKRKYSLTLKPWFAALKLNQDSRIFQDKTAVQIFRSICQEQGFSNYDLSQLGEKYQPLKYCVQYNETSYDFLNRILAEAGIYYTYTHTIGKHTLTLLDSKTAVSKYATDIPLENSHHNQEHIWQWEVENKSYASKTIVGDYDYTKPSLNLLASSKSSGGNQKHEAYIYPGHYKSMRLGEQIASQHHTYNTWQAHQIEAHSNILSIKPNQIFTLSHADNPTDNADYLTISISHKAHDVSHINQENQEELAQSYSNRLTCIASVYKYQPRIYPKPEISQQTAKVTGPEGKKIHTDKYGRVKVKFHWDHLGKNDETSSCWLRVGQISSGVGWGSQYIPRVGEEVTVQYLNNNPDEPLVTGSVYNQTNPEPFSLPGEQNKSGIKTHIENGKTKGHELSFDDTPGKEILTLHSEGDISKITQDSVAYLVKGNETLTTKGKQQIEIQQGNHSIQAKEAHFNVQGSSVILDSSGLSIKPSGKLHLLAKGAGGAKPVARVGDAHKCPKTTGNVSHKGGPVLKGSPISKANGKAVARVGDKLKCRVGSDIIKKGVTPIKVDGKPIAILNSKTSHGGTITKGSPNVYVGNSKGKTVTTVPLPISTISNPCSLTLFSIKCSHGRSFQLDGLHGKPTRKQDYVMQVIAGDKKPDKLTITSKGVCKKGKDCPKLQITTPEKTYTKKTTELDVYSENISIEKDFFGFFKQILIPNSSPAIYTIEPVSCGMNRAHPLTVEAFAPVEWEGKVSLGYKKNKDTDGGNWKLGGKIKVTRNEESWSLGASASKHAGNLSNQLFGNMQNFLDKIFSKICNIKSDYGDITITPPLLEIGGGVSNKELKDKYKVDTEGKISIGMHPLIGIDAEAKILNWLIAIAGSGAFSKFLLMIKARVAEGYNGKYVGAQAAVDIIFSAGMEINGDVSWNKVKQTPWKAQGEVKGEIPLKLEGYAEGSVSFFICKARAGIKAGAESAIGVLFKAGTDKEQPNVHTQFYFNGLTVYWAMYGDLEASSSTKSAKSTIPPAHVDVGSKTASFEKEYKNKYEVFKPVYWPDTPKAINLTDGAL